jgi:hypothetical protein
MARLHELQTELQARGFTVRVEEGSWSLVAKNEAAVGAADPKDPLALIYGKVGLSQRVSLALDDFSVLAWYWEWSGATRGAPGEIEFMCSAADIAEATRLMSRVLALAGCG